LLSFSSFFVSAQLNYTALQRACILLIDINYPASDTPGPIKRTDEREREREREREGEKSGRSKERTRRKYKERRKRREDIMEKKAVRLNERFWREFVDIAQYCTRTTKMLHQKFIITHDT